MLFEELADRWLASIKPDLKPSSYGRRVTAITGLKPFFKGELVSKIGRHLTGENIRVNGA
jgi:hypothetical protein